MNLTSTLRWVTLVFALAISCCCNGGSFAAASSGNEGGTLVFHTAHQVYCADDGTPSSGITCPENHNNPCEDQVDCSSEITALIPTGPAEFGDVEARVYHVLSAFSIDSCPRVAGITFGVYYDEGNIFITDFGSAGDFELSDPSWPEPFAGTAVSWIPAVTAELNEVYWFAAYAYYGPGLVELLPHPTQGGFFADDGSPPVLDQIQEYGILGLGGATGANPAGAPPVLETTWGSIKAVFSGNE